jgi:small GTP-binding protein
MRPSLLTDAQADFLREEKNALAEIRLALAELEAPREALDTLQKAILQLDELFLLVVVGEFNAGKSALVNALLGEKVLAEGVTPTTSRVTLVKWGERAAEKAVDEDFGVFTHPLPLLSELNIVDTPGTNAVIRRHERLTDEFVPRSDLVLFVTSADRPMTESERQFLERIRAWGKKVIFALNKADIFENEAALDEVRRFVLRHAEDVLGFLPEFFPVSARLAQRAHAAPDAAESRQLRERSRIEALETYISATLDDAARLRLKFDNPLGVAEHLIAQMWAASGEQAEALNEDKETAAALESVVNVYEADLKNELSPRLAEIENILLRLQERGLDFFDRTLRLTNIANLARGDRVRAQFEKEVLADVPKQIEEHVHRLIDWLVQKDLHQWQQAMNYLQRRQARYAEHIVGEGAVPLDTRRRALIDSVGRTAQTIVETYDRNREASELASNVETAVAYVAAMEAGAVGLGALVMALVASSALDITGLLAAGTIAIVGFFVIPYKRKQAKDSFKEKMIALRARLLDTLTAQFNHEAEEAVNRIKDGVAPYTRFVRAERERVEKTLDALGRLRQRVSELKAQSEAASAERAP